MGFSMGGAILMNLINRCKGFIEKLSSALTYNSPLLGGNFMKMFTGINFGEIYNESFYPINLNIGQTIKGFFVGVAEALVPDSVFGDSIDKISIIESSPKKYKYIDYYLLRISQHMLPYTEEELVEHYKRIQFHFIGTVNDEFFPQFDTSLMGNSPEDWDDFFFLDQYLNDTDYKAIVRRKHKNQYKEIVKESFERYKQNEKEFNKGF